MTTPNWAGRLVGGLMAAILVVAASANPETVPDYDFRPALVKLAGLGLPDLSGAQWSKNPSALGERDYRLAEAGIRISGIWKLADEPLTLLDAGDVEARKWTEQDGRDADQGGGLMGVLRRLDSGNRKPAEAADRFPAADLAAEVEGIIKALSDPERGTRINQWLEYSDGVPLGKLLLFAAQIHAAGDANLGNRLANTLFLTAPDRETIVDAAVSQIADSRYQSIAERFFKDYDWTAYHKATTDLVETFPRGWDGTLGLAILLPLLERRCSGNPPPSISLPGVTLDPEAVRQLDRLLERPTGKPAADTDQAPEGFDPKMLGGMDWSSVPAEIRSQIIARFSEGSYGESSGTFWLTAPASDPPADADPLTALRHAGMDGFIALVAAIGDDTLTCHRNSDGYRRSGFSFGSRDDPAETARRAYDQINRPATRGELALDLVRKTMPSQDSGLFQSSGTEDIREQAIEFWKEHRDKSPLELASVIMRQGSDDQARQLASMLAGSGDPARHELFTREVLAAENPAIHLGTVLQFASTRRHAARDFAARYSDLLRKDTEGIEADDSGRISFELGQSGGTESILKQIAVAVGLTSLTELIKDAVKAGDEDFPKLARGLSQSIAAADPQQRLTALGKCLAEAPPKRRAAIFSLLLHLEGDGAEPAAAQPDPESIKLWRPLIADETPLDTKAPGLSWISALGARTAGQAAAIGFEALCDPATGGAVRLVAGINESWHSVSPLIQQRVTLRLDGKSPPPWPDGSQIEPPRLAEIVTAVGNASPDEIPAIIRQLSPDERAAWLEWTQDPTDPEVPDSLLALRPRITRVDSDLDPGLQQPCKDLTSTLGLTPGVTVDAALLEKLVHTTLADHRQWSGSFIWLNSAPLRLGISSGAMAGDNVAGRMDVAYLIRSTIAVMERFATDAPAVAVLRVSQNYAAWQWKDGKAVPVTIDEDTDPLEALKSLPGLLSDKQLGEFYIHLSILSREDIQKHSETSDLLPEP